MTKEEQVDALFSRNVFDEIIPSKDELRKRLLSDNPFSIYFGIDATASKIHLGHIQNILILEDLRSLGVKVNLLFGGFTTRIGDPTGRSSARPKLTEKEIKHNIQEFTKQTRSILKTGLGSDAKIVDNYTWTGPMTAEKVVEVASHVTVQQLLNRDSFQKRMERGDPLWVHEMLYPLFQGYDSVAMNIDAELCGTDQLFNALVGRDLVSHYLHKEKIVLTTKLIEDSETGVLMSKSSGTGVFVDLEKGGDDRMFGSIMSLSDGFIEPLYYGATRLPVDTVEKQIRRCKGGNGKEIRDVKMDLAATIVSMFHGEKAGHEARERFIIQFSEQKSHANTPIITLSSPTTILELLVDIAEIASSRARAKQLIKEGAVYINDIRVTDAAQKIDSSNDMVVIRAGRHMIQITGA